MGLIDWKLRLLFEKMKFSRECRGNPVTVGNFPGVFVKGNFSFVQLPAADRKNSVRIRFPGKLLQQGSLCCSKIITLIIEVALVYGTGGQLQTGQPVITASQIIETSTVGQIQLRQHIVLAIQHSKLCIFADIQIFKTVFIAVKIRQIGCSAAVQIMKVSMCANNFIEIWLFSQLEIRQRHSGKIDVVKFGIFTQVQLCNLTFCAE